MRTARSVWRFTVSMLAVACGLVMALTISSVIPGGTALVAVQAYAASERAVQSEPFKPVDRFANRRPLARQGLAVLPVSDKGAASLSYHRVNLELGVDVFDPSRPGNVTTDSGRAKAITSLEQVLTRSVRAEGGAMIRPGLVTAALGTRLERRDEVVEGSSGDPQFESKAWQVPDGRQGSVVAGLGVGECRPTELCVAYVRTSYNESSHAFDRGGTERTPLVSAPIVTGHDAGSVVVTNVAPNTAIAVAVGTFDPGRGPSVVVGWKDRSGDVFVAHVKVLRSADGHGDGDASSAGKVVALQMDGSPVLVGKGTASPGVTLVAGDFVPGGADELSVVGLETTSDDQVARIAVGLLRPGASTTELVNFRSVEYTGPWDPKDNGHDPKAQQYFTSAESTTLVGATAVRRQPRPFRRGDAVRDHLVLAISSQQSPAVIKFDISTLRAELADLPTTAADVNSEKTVLNVGDVNDDGMEDVVIGDTHGHNTSAAVSGRSGWVDGRSGNGRDFSTQFWLASYDDGAGRESLTFVAGNRDEEGSPPQTNRLGLPTERERNDGYALEYVVYASLNAHDAVNQAVVPDPSDPASRARQLYMVGVYTSSNARAARFSVVGLRIERRGHEGPNWRFRYFGPSNQIEETPGPGPQTPSLLDASSIKLPVGREGGVTPVVIAPLALDGVFEVGEPKQTAVRRIEPLVIVNAPPTHFDILNGRPYDLNFCYAGNQYLVPPVCFFKSGYERQSQASTEITSETSETWSVGGSLEFEGEWEGSFLGAKITKTLEVSVAGSYGQKYSKLRSTNRIDTVSVAVKALNTDKIFVLYRQYDVLQYPIYQPGTFEAVGWLAAITPQTLRRRWLDSNSAEASGYRQVHEPGNVLSYPRVVPSGSSGAPFLASNPFARDEFELSDSTDYAYELTTDRMRSEQVASVQQWDIGGSITGTLKFEAQTPLKLVGGGQSYSAKAKFEGKYAREDLNIAKTTVGETTKLTAQLGGIDESLGDVSYSVKPYAYYSTDHALVLDYAVEPSLAAPGDPPTFWQRHYGRHPDPALLLPRRLDVEKQAGISADAARFQSPDVRVLGPVNGSCVTPADRDGLPDLEVLPSPGDKVCLQATMRNYSLRAMQEHRRLRFFVGDPDVGGEPIDLPGRPDGVDVPPIAARGTIRLPAVAWAPSSRHAASNLRIFARIEPGDSEAEVHADNNKGFVALDVNPDGARDLRAPVEVDAEPVQGAARSVRVSWRPPSGGVPSDTKWQVVGYRQDSAERRSIIVDLSQETAQLSGLAAGRWRLAVFAVTPSTGPQSSADPAAGVARRSSPSHPSEPVDIDADVPGAPTSVAAIARLGSADVTWSAPTETGASPITGYRVREHRDAGDVNATPPVQATFDANTQSATITGLRAGQRYRFVVEAINDKGTGPASGPSGDVVPLGLPDPPRSVIASPRDGSVVVGWTVPETDGGAPISGYRVTAYPGGRVISVDGSTRRQRSTSCATASHTASRSPPRRRSEGAGSRPRRTW